MNYRKFGFIGGGRITSVFLEVLTKDYVSQKNVTVCDINGNVLESLKKSFPEIYISLNNSDAAVADVLFISLHPPVIKEVLNTIKNYISRETILISLAPKISVNKLSSYLDGFKKIVRSIPNSPSVISNGYNPLFFSDSLNYDERSSIIEIFEKFGEYKIVDENVMEAYAIITAMGPTYFQFQMNKLYELAHSFGLSEDDSRNAVYKMIEGTNNLLYKSKLNYKEVEDLIPVKPLKEKEADILSIYDSTLIPLFKKLTEGV